MDIRSVLLGFLMYRSMTGYELKKVFSISFSFFSGLSFGSIYPALGRMEREGLITMEMEVRDGSPNRKIYTITDAGRSAFLASLRGPFDFERQKNSFLTRLFFFAHLSPEERTEAASRYIDSVKQVQRELETARPQIEAHADTFQRLCFEFGVRFFDDLVRNLSGILTSLERKPDEAMS
jgi:DNA-binding PadR family transcriptional regulator